MKILQIIDKLNVGGAERVFVDMCTILYENNCNVTALLLLDEGVLDKELNQNIPKIYLNRNNKWNIFKMYECATILKQYEIIHCHCRQVYKYIKLVDLLFFINKKIIFQDHYGITNINNQVPFYLKYIFKPKFYIAVSKNSLKWCKEYLNIEEKCIFFLGNIVVKENIKTHSDNNISYDFILVSNIKSNKNNLFALDLAIKMNKSLFLIGKNQDESYFQSICNFNFDGLKLDSSINNVQQYLKNANLGLHTSVYETGPLVLIEYLAQGLPFLAYETGEVASILKPYFPEYFIDNFDIEKWEERITKLLNATPDYDKMNAVFEKHFGKQHYFEKLNSIYTCIKN